MNKKLIKKYYHHYLKKVAGNKFSNEYLKGYYTGMVDAYGGALGYDPDKIYQDLRTEQYNIRGY